MRKRDSPKKGWDTGVSVLGAFKLDHLQPVELILSQKMSTFLSFILGAPFSYYCRERGRKKGLTMGKRKSSKSEWDTEVLYLGHSNWTICSLSSWFCSQIFPSSWSLYWGVQFLITPKRGENVKKGFTQKWMRHRGFCTRGIQSGSFGARWADFVT